MMNYITNILSMFNKDLTQSKIKEFKKLKT